MSKKPILRKPFQEPGVRTSINLTVELSVWIDKQATARNVSRSKMIADLLSAQQRIQQEISKSFTLSPENDEGTHILHVALKNQTETIANSIERWAGRPIKDVWERVRLGNAMIALTNMLHMPPETYDFFAQYADKVRRSVKGEIKDAPEAVLSEAWKTLNEKRNRKQQELQNGEQR